MTTTNTATLPTEDCVTTTESTKATRAIRMSAAQNRIVTITDPTAEDTVELLAAAEDWGIGNDAKEYWGRDGDGDEWRVHTRPVR